MPYKEALSEEGGGGVNKSWQMHGSLHYYTTPG